MNFSYIIELFLLCALYVSIITFMKHFRNYKLFNCLFTAFTFIPYLALCIVIYLDVGFYDWNFQNVLPTANVSPFMFFTAAFVLILPNKIKNHLFFLISLLSVGMLLSPLFACIYNAAINYKFHFHFTLDYIAHISISLFGIYLIKSKQVKVSIKNAFISASIIFSAASFMMILNVIFDKSFFGLSLNGKHNIYNNVLVDNSYLSALIYFLGLFTVLFFGYLVNRFFDNRYKNVDKATN